MDPPATQRIAPQDEINRKLVEADIVVVIFYSKVGQFTLEEYHLSIKLKKKVFVYFKTGFSTMNPDQYESFRLVLEFREKAENIMWKDYDDVNKFSVLLTRDIGNYLRDQYPIIPMDIDYKDKITYALKERSQLIAYRTRERIWLNVRLYQQSSEGEHESYEQIENGRSIDVKRALGVNVHRVYKENTNVLIFGEAGSGKTTLLELLEHRLIDLHSVWYVPLKFYTISIPDTIFKYYRSSALNTDLIERELWQKEVILLIDGLNELPSNCVDIFFDELEKFLSVKARIAKVWLTCRTQNRFDFMNKSALFNVPALYCITIDFFRKIQDPKKDFPQSLWE